MDMYAALGIEVQITELDIVTGNGQHLSHQPEYYRRIFEHAIAVNARGAGQVTAICMWGPNDANSWITRREGRENDAPLLHDRNNNPKPAYNALTAIVPQSQWGDGNNPAFGGGGLSPVEPDSRGYFFHSTFEDRTTLNGLDGWEARGSTVANSGARAFAGERSVLVSGRTNSWQGVQRPLNPRAFVSGNEYSFSAMVLYREGAATETFYLSIQYTNPAGETQFSRIAEGTVSSGQWLQLANRNFLIPAGAANVIIYVETAPDSVIDFHADEMIGAVAGTVVPGVDLPVPPTAVITTAATPPTSAATPTTTPQTTIVTTAAATATTPQTATATTAPTSTAATATTPQTATATTAPTSTAATAATPQTATATTVPTSTAATATTPQTTATAVSATSPLTLTTTTATAAVSPTTTQTTGTVVTTTTGTVTTIVLMTPATSTTPAVTATTPQTTTGIATTGTAATTAPPIATTVPPIVTTTTEPTVITTIQSAETTATATSATATTLAETTTASAVTTTVPVTATVTSVTTTEYIQQTTVTTAFTTTQTTTAPTTPAVFCEACGAGISASGNFCASCGSSVTTAVTSAATTGLRLGDVTGTGEISISDAVDILRYLAGMQSLTGGNNDSFNAARITGGDLPTILDVIEILRYLAGMNSILKPR
jgi:hypothetical protein